MLRAVVVIKLSPRVRPDPFPADDCAKRLRYDCRPSVYRRIKPARVRCRSSSSSESTSSHPSSPLRRADRSGRAKCFYFILKIIFLPTTRPAGRPCVGSDDGSRTRRRRCEYRIWFDARARASRRNPRGQSTTVRTSNIVVLYAVYVYTPMTPTRQTRLQTKRIITKYDYDGN